ncbi:MAG: hypothetical protein IRY98_02780, partial [Alicyclobacillaceae bacterium]|nr:hypothetical protein [Alicyclobacillaceae bacterium]
GTEERVMALGDWHVELIRWPYPLGVDVPRAVGAAVAVARRARHTLLYDGDWIGDVRHELKGFLRDVERFDVDLALWDLGVDHFPDPALQYLWRQMKKKLPFGSRLEGVHPSLGPISLSARLLRAIPISDVAKPPTLLAHAARLGLRVEVLARCPLPRLASAHRRGEHRRAVIEAVTGDTIEALCVLEQRPRSRQFGGKTYIGAHRLRRWDHLHTLCELMTNGRTGGFLMWQ